MKITGLSVIIAFLIVLGLAACSDQSTAKLIGVWTNGEDRIEITKTHILIDGGGSVEYKIENGSIIIFQTGFTDDKVIANSYKIVGNNTLKFIGNTSEETFTRVK
jgi:hypothetical protein